MLILAHAVALLGAVAFERAWPAALRWGGVAPSFALILIACIGITRGPLAGCAAGLFGGFLAATVGEAGFGATLMSHMVIGFACGQARGRVFADHVLVAPVIATLVVILAAFIELVISPSSHFLPWLAGLGRSIVFTAVGSPIAYLYARAVSRRWPQRTEA